MDTSNPAKDKNSQQIIRDIVELCGDCDTCRPILDRDCLFFPELYRLWDREMESGVPITDAELHSLMELCTLCGLCPCPNIPADLMEAKGRYIDRNGLPLTTRLLNDVPAVARLCATFPRLVDALCTSRRITPLLRRAAGIHPARRLPSFAKRNFFQWAKTKGLTTRRKGGRTVAYFAGCSAGYLFQSRGYASRNRSR